MRSSKKVLPESGSPGEFAIFYQQDPILREIKKACVTQAPFI
jgi:hypothetical protein